MASSPGSGDLLVTAGAVVTVDDATTVHAPGALLVEGDRIAAVGPVDQAVSWQARRRIDRPDCVVIPGFVDAHDHLFQSLARHRGDGLGLHDWLRTCMWPYADTLSVPDAVAATTLSALELVLAGVTTVLDHAYAPVDPLATVEVTRTISSVGLRGFVARGCYGTPLTPRPPRRPSPLDTAAELALLRDLMGGAPAPAVGTAGVRVVPGPTNVATVEPGVLTGATALARQFAVPWQSHCCEVSADADAIRARTGTDAISWLDHLQVLDPHATLAHAIWLDDGAAELLAARGAGLVHCPSANVRCGSGTMPLTALREAGVHVGMGFDGSAGHHPDPFESMRLAIGLQRLRHGPAALSAGSALAIATRGGAEVLGVDAGVLEPGRLADFTAVRLPHIDDGPVVDRVVWGCTARDVSDVFVGGRAVVDGGRCTTADVVEALARADEAVRRIWARAT